MRFSLSWLKEHLDTTASLSTICDTLTRIGLEVESVDNPASQIKGFQVAKIVDTRPHPDADRLKICIVDCGEDTPLQVVCGAPNARPGIYVVLGRPGSYVPALDITLKATKIRGVESFGMLCSAKELNLGEDQQGILEISPGPLGTAYADHAGLNDPIIDVAITPNRPDCLGVRGIARDLAAAGLGVLKPFFVPAVPGHFNPTVQIRRQADAEKGCPHYMGRVIRNVSNRPSPEWLKQKLAVAGVRSISGLVDITNYVSLDLCRPLHVFDQDKLSGDVHIRLSQKDERFEALDEQIYTLSAGHVVVADDHHIAALGGVMGGMHSGCSLETKTVLLESAYFDPAYVANAGRSLNLHSDARHRFERGIDPLSTEMGLQRATQLILELCGGEASDIIDCGAPEFQPIHIPFSEGLVTQKTGMTIPMASQKSILEKLGFTVDDTIVSPPSWRPDVMQSIDVVEEISRIYGYDHLPAVKLPPKTVSQLSPIQTGAVVARHGLAARGYHEVITWSMVSSEEFSHFGGVGKDLEIANPITVDLMYMRPSVLPHLLRAVQKNIDHGQCPLSLFEVGPQYDGLLWDAQIQMVSGVSIAEKQKMHWSNKPPVRDVFDVKGDVYALLEQFHIDPLSTQTSAEGLPSWYHPGRAAWVQRGPKNRLAVFGEIHPKMLQFYGIKERVFAFEVFMDTLMPLKIKGKVPFQKIDFPTVSRDFSFLFPRDVLAQDIIKIVKKVDSSLVFVDVFDVYEGADIPDGKKSLSLHVRFQPTHGTFTDAEIKDLYNNVLKTVEGQLRGKLRL